VEVWGMKTISALDLRKKLGTVLTDVFKQKEPVVISRANKPLAVIISVEDFEEKVLKKNRERGLKELSLKMDEWKKVHRLETRHIDAVQAVRDIRNGYDRS
jgi:prevent-host-death family protein